MPRERWSADAIAAATPAERNRYVDALRLGSITVVVLGHWLFAVVTVRQGRITTDHLLTVEPWTQWLTWILQVMPVFFFVGGYANAVAWSSALARDEGWTDWVRARARRLLRPALPLLVLWVPLAAVLAALGVPAALVQLGTQVVIVPLWFLAVYLLVVAVVPLTHAWHRRHGLRVLVGMALLAAALDAARRLGVPAVAWANYALVWGAVHQAGYLWRDGKLPRSRRGMLAMAAAGFGALALLVFVAGYPLSMVGVGDDTNNTPPTVALLALATAQAGLILAGRRTAERLLARPRAWALVVGTGSFTMSVYLWHMTAMVAVIGALYPTGIWPATAGVDATWWLQRPLWILACGLTLTALVGVFGRFERAGPPRRRSSRLRAAAGVAAATAGLAMLTLGGLYHPGGRLGGLPLSEVGLLALGLGLLGVLRRDSAA
jgi:fucose 4-O-acetylase-like acetyltransferase